MVQQVMSSQTDLKMERLLNGQMEEQPRGVMEELLWQQTHPLEILG
jgi:hypothetical protein